jgi:hypothetical protein
MADVRPVPQVPGAEVDDFSGASSKGGCVGPETIDGLNICIKATPAFGVLIVESRPPTHYHEDRDVRQRYGRPDHSLFDTSIRRVRSNDLIGPKAWGRRQPICAITAAIPGQFVYLHVAT